MFTETSAFHWFCVNLRKTTPPSLFARCARSKILDMFFSNDGLFLFEELPSIKTNSSSYTYFYNLCTCLRLTRKLSEICESIRYFNFTCVSFYVKYRFSKKKKNVIRNATINNSSGTYWLLNSIQTNIDLWQQIFEWCCEYLYLTMMPSPRSMWTSTVHNNSAACFSKAFRNSGAFAFITSTV